MVTGLAHLCLTVSDLEASVAFYCDKLGLRQAFDFVNDAGERFGVYLHVGGRAFIELFQAQEKQENGGSCRHMCLEVDDIESTVAMLRREGVAVGEITMGADNAWQAWLEDPDGNRIELHCYTRESRQSVYLSQSKA